MRRGISLASISFLLVGLSFSFGLLANASAEHAAHQTANCMEGMSAEQLGIGLPDAADGYDLRLLRVTFEPGGHILNHIHPGSLTLSIESGELTYGVVEGEAEVIRASNDDEAAAEPEVLEAGDETVLGVGDWLFEQSIIHYAHNYGDEPTVVLVAGLMQEGQPFSQCVE